MPKIGPPKRATADNLEEFAKSLDAYATEYRRLAGLLREYGIGDMEVGIYKTGKDGMDNLASFGASAMRGYLEAVNRKGLGWEKTPEGLVQELSNLPVSSGDEKPDPKKARVRK